MASSAFRKRLTRTVLNCPRSTKPNGGLLKTMDVYLDRLLLRPAADEVAGLSNHTSQVTAAALRRRQTREVEKPLHDLSLGARLRRE